MECPSIKDDYNKESYYFCYEYLLPFEKVTFDGAGNEITDTSEKKQRVLVKEVLARLSDYQNCEEDELPLGEPPILRLGDYDIADEKYYIGREEISKDMIF